MLCGNGSSHARPIEESLPSKKKQKIVSHQMTLYKILIKQGLPIILKFAFAVRLSLVSQKNRENEIEIIKL